MTKEISALTAGIDKKKKILDSLRPLTEGELIRLREQFLIDYTYNSTAIEGNTLTLRETAMVLEGITIDRKPLKDHLEAVGHRDAFLYVLDLVDNKTDISESIIKNIHSLVLMDKAQDRGIYRNVPVIISGAAHTPPQPYLIAPQMEELIRKNKDLQSKHIIEHTALFHLLFEGIHPFIDGNGRTGRLLMNLELMKRGYLPVSIKFTDRRRYYDAFQSYFYGDNGEAMIKLAAEYENAELDRYIQMFA